LVSVLKRSKYSHANESYELDRTQEYLLVIPILAYSCQFELDDARNKLVFHYLLKVIFSRSPSGRTGL